MTTWIQDLGPSEGGVVSVHGSLSEGSMDYRCDSPSEKGRHGVLACQS